MRATRSTSFLLLLTGLVALGSCQQSPRSTPPATAPTTQIAEAQLLGFRFPAARDHRDAGEVAMENKSCVACHGLSDTADMHNGTKAISCIDCHGGNATVAGLDPDRVKNLPRTAAAFVRVKDAYHVHPTHPEIWAGSSGNPIAPGASTLQEDVNFVRFVNPGDLRAAQLACGACHNTPQNPIVDRVRRNMMTHGSMLWEAALYNNGAVNRKAAVYGESYALDAHGHARPASLRAASQPTTREARDFGWLAELLPLPRWEISQPGNVLRVFERGARERPVVGIPNPEEDTGRPDVKLSVRGFGTDTRTDPVFLGLQKTRLLDPTLNLFGTNDHPGDYRSSGCTSCHVVYANDRSPIHSGRMAAYGNRGESFSVDRRVNPLATTQPYGEAELASAKRTPREGGHPISHTFVQNVPTSSCIVCHVHPGTNVLNSYLGFMWWDNETDGQFLYPKQQKYPTADQEARVSPHNPEQTAARGLWSNLYPDDFSQAGLKAGRDFLENVTSLNPLLKHLQFADFHGHGWIFRAVFKQDRHGNLLSAEGTPLDHPDAAALGAGVAFATATAPLPAGNADFSDDKFLAKTRKQLKEGQAKTQATTQAVHLKDIHLEKGMQCVDCHFEQDNHGGERLFGETRAAVTIGCVDCHGSVTQAPVLARYLLSDDKKEKKKLLPRLFTGAAATQPSDGDLASWDATVRRHFKAFDAGEGESPVVFQISATDPKRGWYVKLTASTGRAEPSPVFASDDKAAQKHFAAARYAHGVRKLDAGHPQKPSFGFDEKEQKLIADGKLDEGKCLAHSAANVSCYACHSAWNTSCFGCHLPMRANQNQPMLHNEGVNSRNYTNYNFQTLRDDVYMLGVDSTVTGHKVVPVRSACAVLVSSQDAQRQWIYAQQQTVSAEGFAGTAFSPYFPHTVRAAETKRCTDCHLSKANDNNAVMAQLLMQGTNSVNFVGRNAWVAEGDGGLEAVAVTEREEPQAVMGSKLHSLAYPDYFAAHQKRGRELTEAHGHEGTVYDVQLRGEYLYAACGAEGFVAYDVANVENKGFSERITAAPVSPVGQRFFVPTKFATSVCSPSTLALDPTRDHRPENEELGPIAIGSKSEPALDDAGHPVIGGVHPLYAFLYVTDAEEGLIVVGNRPDSEAAKKSKPGVASLLDGDPENNFLSRALTYNPGGLLRGARHVALYGHYAYVSCDAGLVVVDLDNPLSPKVTKVIATLNRPRKVAFQFRYAFVVDADGLKVLNVTDPTDPKVVPDAFLPIADARDVYVCRTFGYVAAGRQGLVVVDLENPELLRRESISAAAFDPAEFRKPAAGRARRSLAFNDAGRLCDATAVRVGMTNNSLYAYVADGVNGLKVLQLTSDDTPGFTGFSPIPVPRVIAQHKTRGPALSLSKGLDRDRAVDESGHQLSVFGRRGARPFTLEEQRHLYLVNPADPVSGVWAVSDDPATATDRGK